MRDTLSVARNGITRTMLRWCIALAGRRARRNTRRKIERFEADQAALRTQHGRTATDPIRAYGDEVRAAIEAKMVGVDDVQYAFTSGSTDKPKRIAYPPARVSNVQAESFSIAAQIMLAYRVKQPVLYILASFKKDDSLTSLVLGDEGAGCGYCAGLVAPARALRQPCTTDLVDRYGATAVRLWSMALCSPGMIYSTNPSTLAVFLHDVHAHWETSTALVRDYLALPDALGPDVRRMARRIAHRGWRRRFDRIAASNEPLPAGDLFPDTKCYCCWDGGYVRPFLEEVQKFLRPPQFHFVPMYSVSTETVATLNVLEGDTMQFLPLSADVLYEFIPEGAEDAVENLLLATELKAGRTYAMVVSDPYGLRRYQTDDLFYCRGLVDSAPDLQFLRRRGLSYSFTGEKLTDTQVVEAFRQLRDDIPGIRAGGYQLALIPSRPGNGALPGYRLALASPGATPDVGPDLEALGGRLDEILSEINVEFAQKLASQRLARTGVVEMSFDWLAARLDGRTTCAGDVQQRAFDSQFKMLPLYQKLWEDYGLDRS